MRNEVMKDLPHEVWRDVVGYEGLYEVSSLGRVRSLDRVVTKSNGVRMRVDRKMLTLNTKRNGYFVVTLSKGNSCVAFYVHRLVASAFIPNPQNLPQVNHKDEGRTNNSVDNLEWCTNKYNNTYGTKVDRAIAKNGYPVSQFLPDGTLVKTYRSVSDAERETGVYHSSIVNVVNGKMSRPRGEKPYVHKTAGGFVWKKAE